MTVGLSESRNDGVTKFDQIQFENRGECQELIDINYPIFNAKRLTAQFRFLSVSGGSNCVSLFEDERRNITVGV